MCSNKAKASGLRGLVRTHRTLFEVGDLSFVKIPAGCRLNSFLESGHLIYKVNTEATNIIWKVPRVRVLYDKKDWCLFMRGLVPAYESIGA